ncbi:hypothetical protein F441_23155, partial [Phytophthora nicotianae CJ01A1]
KDQDVHASRLKFYADSDLEVTEELLEHVASQGIVSKVNRLNKHRWIDQKQVYELLLSWCGLEPIEDSWEPFRSLAQGIPALTRTYVEAAEDAKLATAFQKLTSS